jgi:hypothetical protein
MSDKNENSSFLSILKTVGYNILFKLPFADYESMYESGKIHEMSNEEKKDYIFKLQQEDQHKKFFLRLIAVRKMIMDEEDVFEYNLLLNKVKRNQKMIFIGLFANWIYFSFNFMVLRKRKLMMFFIINISLLVTVHINNIYLHKEQQKLFLKYKSIFPYEDIVEVMKKVYNIS